MFYIAGENLETYSISLIKSPIYWVNRKPIIGVSEMIFLLAFSFLCLSNLFELTVFFYADDMPNAKFKLLLQLMRYGAYFLAVIKLIYDNRHKSKFILGTVLFASFAMLIVAITTDRTLVFYILIGVAAYNVHPKNLILVSAVSKAFVIVLTGLLSQMGLLIDYMIDKGIRDRHFLGFGWTTTAPILFLFFILEYIYIREGRLRLVEYIVLLVPSCFFYVFTDSRFAFLISILVLVFFFLFSEQIRHGYLERPFKALFVLLPELIALFAICIHLFYNEDNRIWRKLNSLLTRRLEIGHRVAAKYGIELLGNKIKWVGNGIEIINTSKYNYIDSSYLRILIHWGVLMLLAILVLYSLMIKWSIESERYYVVWIMFFALMLCVTEPRLVDLSFNSLILLILPIAYYRKRPPKKVIYTL